jgi:nucleoside permease NupC
MEITFNTPALLFPAISLLLLAYTNRYLALASLIRKLHDEYMRGEKNHLLLKQIRILKIRINLVRQMQALSVLSFLCSVITMYGVYLQWELAVKYVFALSLLSLLASLIISLVEITQSTKALELEISDMEELENTNFFKEVWKGKDEGKKE